MHGQVRQRCDHADPIVAGFAHADDAAAADMNAGGADMIERVQTILIRPSADDLAVKFG